LVHSARDEVDGRDKRDRAQPFVFVVALDGGVLAWARRQQIRRRRGDRLNARLLIVRDHGDGPIGFRQFRQGRKSSAEPGQLHPLLRFGRDERMVISDENAEAIMTNLAGKIAWVTGAGSGIGEAAALALAEAGATVVLTGRRLGPLQDVAHRISQTSVAHVQPADLTKSDEVRRVGDYIRTTFNRLDILVNNAGINIVERDWDKLTPASIDTLLQGNLTGALYCVTIALPFMRAQKDGLLIHTASMAGRFIGGLSGPIYTVAKHGIVAMSHGLNMKECINGIRSTVFLPGEVATPILDKRPNPVGPEIRARMVQPADCGNLIRYIACLPRHVVMNEVHLSPTHNRSYIAALQHKI
jgi:NADP-dependent 3-hydroxy acid dehydrogenase YdfG